MKIATLARMLALLALAWAILPSPLAAGLGARLASSGGLFLDWATRGASGGARAAAPAGPYALVRVEAAEAAAAPVITPARPGAASRSTLELEDLVPEWRGPGADRKDG